MFVKKIEKQTIGIVKSDLDHGKIELIETWAFQQFFSKSSINYFLAIYTGPAQP